MRVSSRERRRRGKERRDWGIILLLMLHSLQRPFKGSRLSVRPAHPHTPPLTKSAASPAPPSVWLCKNTTTAVSKYKVTNGR